LTYSAIPVVALYKSGLLDGTTTPETENAVVTWKWQALVVVNYLIPYIILVFLQFKSLRRFSQKKLLGLALSTQEQQRKLYVTSILWILSFIISLVNIPIVI
jgi:hypothetical protein